jgi:hypothetical protein
MVEADAQSLLRRAERVLWIAETIAAQAQRDDDARLALQAVDSHQDGPTRRLSISSREWLRGAQLLLALRGELF